MGDGDNANASAPIRDLLFRGDSENASTPCSYFFQHQVQRCFTEQEKILEFQLSEKEQEAQIVYDNSIKELFSPDPQIDSTFAKIIFDSKESVNLNDLVGELSLLAGGGKEDQAATTRFLDLLFVIGNKTRLLEEQEDRGVHYDLYNAEAKDTFDAMAALPKLLSSHQGPKTTEQLAMMFSLIATGQKELITSALVFLAKVLNYPWDALVLARYLLGANHEVTEMVRTIWSDRVLKDEQYKMIEIACSLHNNDMLTVARKLMKPFSNKKTEPVAPIQAYRCLAIFLSSRSDQQSDLKMQVKMGEASRVMCDILMTILGFGKTQWAKSMLDDLSKRAPPGEIPPDICQIGLRCLVELNELVLKTQKFISSAEPLKDDEFEKMALKWRGKINQGSEGMDKLKTETGDSQKVVYSWIHRLCDVLRKPLTEETDKGWTPKMECALLAVEFLPEMIRWAVIGKKEESLKLVWPDDKISFAINDKSIFVMTGDRRSRTVSRSTSVANDDKKNQKKKGDAKEAHQTDQRSEQNNPRTQQPLIHNQKSSLENASSSKPTPINQNGGGNFQGQGSHQSNVDQWARGQPAAVQDIRRIMQHSGGGDNSGRITSASVSSELAKLGLGPNTTGGGAQTHGVAPTGNLSNTRTYPNQSSRPHEQMNRNRSNPASASSSGVDVSARTAMTPSISSPSKVTVQSTPCSPKTLRPPKENVTPEEVQARLDENLKKKAARSETEKKQEVSGQLPSASPSISSSSIANQPTAISVEEQQQQQSSAPPLVQSSQQSDSHYDDLMKQSNENNGMMAPEPAEMNKLFTGGTNGQSTLPPSVMTEQLQQLNAQPPPAVVPAAASASSSADSVLTAITEASQESSRATTVISESDAPGMYNEPMVDAVFTPVKSVDTKVECETVLSETPAYDAPTPKFDDLVLDGDAYYYSINDSCQSISEIQEMQRQDTPTVSPQMSSPQVSSSTDTSATEVQERTTSCGISYTFSSSNAAAPSPTVSSVNMVEQQLLQPAAEAPTPAMDMFLSMLGGDQAAFGNEQTAIGATSMTNSQSEAVTRIEMDDHAALRTQEASESGNLGSAVESPFVPASIPSMPSTTVVTSPESNEQQFAYPNNGGYGSYATVMPTVSQPSIPSHSSPSVHNWEPVQSYQQSAQPLESGQQDQQQFVYPNNGGYGSYATVMPTANQPSIPSHSSTSVHDWEPVQSYQQSAQPLESGQQDQQPPLTPLPVYQSPFEQPQQQQQMSNPILSGGEAALQQPPPLPVYTDPFEQGQHQPPQQQQLQNNNNTQDARRGGGYGSFANQNQTGRNHSNNDGFRGGGSGGRGGGGGGDSTAPCFGTGAANAAQTMPQPQQQQSDTFGQNQSQNQQGFGGQGDTTGNQSRSSYGQGGQNQRGGGNRGDRRGGGGGRGDGRGGRGGDRRGRGRGGGEQQQSGSGFGGGQHHQSGSGFSGGQHHQSGSGFSGGQHHQSGSGFGGGENGIGNGFGPGKGHNQQHQQGGSQNGGGWGSGDNNAHQKHNQSSSNQGNFSGQPSKRGFHN